MGFWMRLRRGRASAGARNRNLNHLILKKKDKIERGGEVVLQEQNKGVSLNNDLFIRWNSIYEIINKFRTFLKAFPWLESVRTYLSMLKSVFLSNNLSILSIHLCVSFLSIYLNMCWYINQYIHVLINPSVNLSIYLKRLLLCYIYIYINLSRRPYALFPLWKLIWVYLETWAHKY